MSHTHLNEFYRRTLGLNHGVANSADNEIAADDVSAADDAPDDGDILSTTGLRNIGSSIIGGRPPIAAGVRRIPIKPTPADPDLGTHEQELQTSQFAHCRVYIHGIYAGAPFDDFLSGSTGEWYFTSLATDGKEIVGVGSKDMGDENGRWVKVTSGSWLNTGDRLIWPSTENYNEVKDLGVPNGNIVIALNVMEDDDGELAKSILNKVGKISRAWLDQQAPGNLAAGVTHDQILSLAQDVLDIYAADDRPVSESVGLDQNTNYRIGRFIRVEGHQRTYAILSVQPKGNADINLYQIEDHELPPGVSERSIRLTTGEDTPKLVAIFIRPPVYYPGFPAIRIEVLNPLHEGRSFKVTSRPGLFHTMVKGGGDDIKIRVTAPIGAVMRIMATVVSKEGAAEYSD